VYTVVDIMTLIVRKTGKKFEQIHETNFHLEDKLQDLIHEDQIIKKIKLGPGDDVRLVTLSRELESGSGPIDVLAIDEDGDIYIVETKLKKNPDRRKILAQIMDYAGAMWNRFDDFNTFEDQLQQHNSTSKHNNIISDKSLSDIIDDAISSEDSPFSDNADRDKIIKNMQACFKSGEFKFITVWDKLESELINTINYLNEKTSITIYAVTFEYYKNDDLEILIPSIYGRESEKRSVVKGKRFRWTLEGVKQNFKNNFTPDEYIMFKKLYQFLEENVDSMRPGTGRDGSINFVFNKLCPETGTRGSFLTLSGNGFLTINYPWLKPEYRKKIAESFSENPKLKIDYKSRSLLNSDTDLNDDYPKYSRDQWSDNVDSIIETIKKFI
jgi:hypothetical protein